MTTVFRAFLRKKNDLPGLQPLFDDFAPRQKCVGPERYVELLHNTVRAINHVQQQQQILHRMDTFCFDTSKYTATGTSTDKLTHHDRYHYEH